jgi:hypothetical protein
VPTRVKKSGGYTTENIEYVFDTTRGAAYLNITLANNEYNSFGSEYIRDGFCWENGGFWVTHKGHVFDKRIGEHEKIVASILYKRGNMVVLENETGPPGSKHPDGLLNHNTFEIKSIEAAGKNTIKRAFEKAYRQGASHIILYFPVPTLFSHNKIIKGYSMFLGIGIGDMEKIWVVVGDDIIKMR